MYEEIFIKFEEKIYKVFSKKNIIRDFEFVMREYVTFEREYHYLCNLDKMSFFEHPVIRKKYMVINGAAVYYKGYAIIILASPYSGKTSLICELIKKGANLISDDLLLINRNTLKILPLHKPMCFRKNAIETYNITEDKMQLNKIEYRCFEDDYGKRYLVHPFDILEGKYKKEDDRINKIYIKSEGKNYKDYYNMFFKHIKNICKEDVVTVIKLRESCKCIKICDFAEILEDI